MESRQVAGGSGGRRGVRSIALRIMLADLERTAPEHVEVLRDLPKLGGVIALEVSNRPVAHVSLKEGYMPRSPGYFRPGWIVASRRHTDKEIHSLATARAWKHKGRPCPVLLET